MVFFSKGPNDDVEVDPGVLVTYTMSAGLDTIPRLGSGPSGCDPSRRHVGSVVLVDLVSVYSYLSTNKNSLVQNPVKQCS